MMQSRENGQKPQFKQFFDDFEVKYLQIGNFSEKWVSFKLKVIFSTNFRPKTKKIVRAVFEKNIKVSNFGLIWRRFREFLQIKIFFQSGSVTFLPLQSPNFMQKIRKITRALSEKTALPTNEPNIKVSDFWKIWSPYCEYLQIKNFFQKSGSVTFLHLQPPNFMQNTRKILRAVSEKNTLSTNQPTNQPTNYYQQYRSYRTSLTPVQ